MVVCVNKVAQKRERMTQAERRRVTRGRLLDATIESLIEVGYPRTTTVGVGERSGLSRGAQLHHFPSKADLLIAAIEHLAAERDREFEAELTARWEETTDPVGAMVDMLWSMFSGPLFWAVFELMVACRTDDELREKFEQLERRLGSGINRAFKKFTGRNDREAKIAIEMTLFFLRGLAIERIFRDNEAHYDALVERWKDYVRRMLA